MGGLTSVCSRQRSASLRAAAETQTVGRRVVPHQRISRFPNQVYDNERHYFRLEHIFG